MLIGGVCGLANGLLVTRLSLPPFVATLGMFGIARGVAVWLAERTTLAFPIGARPEWVEWLASAQTEFINPGLWSLVLLAIAHGGPAALHGVRPARLRGRVERGRRPGCAA